MPTSSWWTPKSEAIDAQGNVVQTTGHKAFDNGTAYEYNKGGAFVSLKLDATKHLAAAAEHSNRKYMLRGCISMRLYGRSIANAAERKLFR